MIQDFIHIHSLPSYREKQFNTAYYQELIGSYDDLSTWPKDLRFQLQQELPFISLREIKHVISLHHDTEKILFERISDKKRFETVLMRHADGRNTVCVSCMIGCPVGCAFCATGRMGFQGNLTSEEIVDQVLFIARILKGEKQTITNIVFMGMGEPLLNLKNVIEAISIFTDPKKMGMSERRITVSTSGHTDNLKKLLAGGYAGRLALSLHAPNQKLREQLMPIAKKFPLDDLLVLLQEHAIKTNKRVSFEYTLINGVNDTQKDAEELASLLRHRLTHVNLIPFNPVLGIALKRSTPEAIQNFSRVLTNKHVHHTVRVTMGDDIAAACGQLAGKI
jgi:23S rRNA (adenine2503-C2)-methyltransferase